MSSDRLIRTAQAAGFAMACDDVGATQAAKLAAAAQAASMPWRGTSLAIAPPPREVQQNASNWALPSWSFWKTA